MAVIMKLEVPGATLAQYDRTNEILQIGGDSDAPAGLVQHVCGATTDGIVIVDVWDSKESLDRFFEERLSGALAEAGVPEARPQIVKLHNAIPRGRGTVASVIVITELAVGTDDYDHLIETMDAHLGAGEQHPCFSHFAGAKDGGGMLIVDLWESPDAFAQFAHEQIEPADGDTLGDVEPRFVPLHKLIRGAATVGG